MDRGLDRKQRAKTKWFRNEMKTEGGKRNGLKTKWFYLVHDFIGYCDQDEVSKTTGGEQKLQD